MFRERKVKWSEVTQSCLTLCNPMDCSPLGSSIHGIFLARVLEQVAISFSRGSSRSKDRTQGSHIVGRHFTIWATREDKKERKFVNPHGWAMYFLFLRFRLWQMGFSYRPKKSMDESSWDDPRKFLAGSRDSLLALWPEDIIVFFVYFFICFYNRPQRRVKMKRTSLSAWPGLLIHANKSHS